MVRDTSLIISSSAITMNLPSGSCWCIVAVADYTRTFATNNLTVTPNGSQKIGGYNQSFVLSTNGQAATLVYVDDTEGWINVHRMQQLQKLEYRTFCFSNRWNTNNRSGNFKNTNTFNSRNFSGKQVH